MSTPVSTSASDGMAPLESVPSTYTSSSNASSTSSSSNGHVRVAPVAASDITSSSSTGALIHRTLSQLGSGSGDGDDHEGIQHGGPTTFSSRQPHLSLLYSRVQGLNASLGSDRGSGSSSSTTAMASRVSDRDRESVHVSAHDQPQSAQVLASSAVAADGDHGVHALAVPGPMVNSSQGSVPISSVSSPSMVNPVVCHLTMEELLSIHEEYPEFSPLNVFSFCPGCEAKVAFHSRRGRPMDPTFRVSSSAAAMGHSDREEHGREPRLSSSAKSGEGFLKLKKDLPVWKEGAKKTCFEFLRDLTELLSTTEYPRDTWYRVLPLVVEEGFNRTWVHNNIVSLTPAPSSWEAACKLFTEHFECSDYLDRVWSRWHALRFEHGESVQHFADRFRVMLAELDLDNDAKIVKKHFIKCLPAAIKQKYDEFCMAKDLDLGAEAGSDSSSKYEPKDVDTIIKICVRIDTNQRGRYHSASGSGGHTYTSSAVAKTTAHTTSVAGSKNSQCPVHPSGSHSWSECRQNAANASTGTVHVKREGSNKTDYASKPKNTHTSTGTGTFSAKSSSSSSSTAGPAKKKEMNIAEVRCYKCDQMGHYANNCPNKPGATANVRMVKTTSEESVESDAGACGSKDLLGKGQVALKFTETDDGYTSLIDTGADLSIISKSLADRLGLARVPSEGTLNLAISGVRAQREYRTTPIKFTAVFSSSVKDTQLPNKKAEGSFEILPLPPHDHPIIIGKDLIPVLFGPSISMCYLSPPPAGIPSHVLNSDHVHVPKLLTATESPIAIATAPAVDTHDGTGDQLQQEDSNAPAVFTAAELEDEYAKHRGRLMSDTEIVHALAENEKVVGFCTHPDSVLKLAIKPFVDGVVPKKLCRPQYRIPEKVRPLVREVIQRWFDEGKIIKAPPGIPYNTPIVVAPKKDSEGNVTWDEIRVCLDFRGTNEEMECEQMDQFQLPFIRDTMDKFNGCKVFGEFDLQEAFYQFELHKDSRPFTAFTFEGTQYMCAGVPFGLSIVPSHFQRVISTILHGLDFTFPYMDNIPLGSKDWTTHKRQALQIISRLTQYNLKIKPSSVKLGHSHMRCLGHLVSVNGIGVDPKKLSMIPGWPRPTTGKELMSFLGFVTFIRDHIRHVADLTGPLEAVKNSKTLEWDDTLEQAFVLTKKAVMSAPFLQYPDYTRPFHVATDASNTGVGGVLFQPKKPGEYITPHNIVAICSKKLQSSQTRWSAYKKEYFGILYCLRQFRPYIWGRNDLVVYTDHKPLTFVLSSPTLSTTVHGWFDEISDYNFKVIHRPGILNVVPDALSRMYAGTYADVWGVASKYNMSNIELVPEQDTVFKDVTGPSLKPVSMGEGAAAAVTSDTPATAEAKEDVDMTTNIRSSADFDLHLELEKRGMSMPSTPEEAIELVQQEHAMGHFGISAIYKSLLSKKKWWPKMRKTITEVVQDCHQCNVHTVTKTGYNPLGFIHARGPWEHVQVDTSVHLPPSPDGMTTLLVVVDVFTGFVILRACKSSTAEEIAQQLWDIFCTFGFPKILQSDNGHEFVNDLLRVLVKISGVEHRFITPYNPRADGKVEKKVHTSTSVIKKMTHGANRSWPTYVPFTQYAANLKISTPTESAPFSLMLGRKANEWVDYTKEPPERIPLDFEEQLSKWKEHQDKMVSLLFPAIYKKVLGAKNEMVMRWNKVKKTLVPRSLKMGTVVYLVDPLKTDKWQPKYLGPYTVVRRAHNGGYVLRDSTGDILDRHVTIDQLKVLSSKKNKAEDQDSSKESQSEEDESLDEVAYAVERIKDHRGDNPSNYEFFVKWVGYPETDNSWVPIANFEDKNIITKYFKALSQANNGQALSDERMSSSLSSEESAGPRGSSRRRL